MERLSVHPLAKHWVGRLAHYRTHRNSEHLEALFEEAIRFAGLQLETDLANSAFWSAAPLLRRAAVLLFLLDRGVVFRQFDRTGAVYYEVHPGAESWVAAQSALAAYVHPTFELLSALRNNQAQRLLSSGSA